MAALGEQNVPLAIEQEVSAPLIDVFLAMVFAPHPFTK